MLMASRNWLSFAQASAPLAVTGLSVAYGAKPVLAPIDYHAPHHGLIAIIGPNGAGKSTFLKAALGIVRPLSGHVRFFGEPLAQVRERIAYMPQRASVDWDFPATARDVALMGLYRQIGPFRFAGKAHKAKALEALARVGMADFAHRQIGQLSGGQQQRVFLARALAQDADLYLLDEPLAGVDIATEDVILAVLRDLDAQGKSIICVHHDLASLRDTFDHVLMIAGGRIADGPVETTFTAANLQATYGGRLSAAQIAQFGIVPDASFARVP